MGRGAEPRGVAVGGETLRVVLARDLGGAGAHIHDRESPFVLVPTAADGPLLEQDDAALLGHAAVGCVRRPGESYVVARQLGSNPRFDDAHHVQRLQVVQHRVDRVVVAEDASCQRFGFSQRFVLIWRQRFPVLHGQDLSSIHPTLEHLQEVLPVAVLAHRLLQCLELRGADPARPSVHSARN